MKQTITILLTLFTVVLTAQVNIQGNPYGGNPYGSIQAAIDVSTNVNDIIEISGVFTESISIAKGITLRGTNPLNDIIQANAAPLTATTRVITIAGTAALNVNVTIENLGIKNGNIAAVNGGGINIDKITGLVTLKKLIIENNKTTLNGGAVGIAGSNADIIECTIKNNTAVTDGGAIIAAPNNASLIDNVVNIKQSLINANTGRNGGGIYINGNLNSGNTYKIAVNIENSTISNNTASNASASTALAGGGAICSNSQAWVPNSAIGNVTLNLIHATLYGNKFATSPTRAGIQCNSVKVTNFSAYNSIIVSTDDLTVDKAINFANTNIINIVNCIFGGTNAPPTIVSDPVPNANNNEAGKTATYAGLTGTLSNEGGNTQAIKLNGGSTAVGYCTATTGITIPTIDQTGYTRSGAYDAGAYELTGTTWTGGTSTDWTNASNWNNGLPTSSSNVKIAAAFNQPIIANNIDINSMTITSGAILNVASGNLSVTGAVANRGTMTLENNANLIQGGTTNTNTGNVIVKRNSSALLRLDYTLWSSPVVSQNLLAFSPATTTTRFYDYNTTYSTGGVNGAYSAIADPSATNFTAGKGYLIRMPNDADAVTPTAYPGVFTGKPNNGTISVPLVDGLSAGLRYNLVGNPYPSPITMSTFVTDNAANIESTLYFWRKTNGSGTAYCTWVPGPGTGTFTTNNNIQSVDPLGIIQTGQGFFVEAKSGASSLTFNNLQRVANNIGQFFKTKKVAETNRVWLNATNTSGAFSQMAVTYTTDATQGVDIFDGKYINDSPVALTSNINNEEYTIQGRALPFDPSDVVALNFKTDAAGVYTISLDHFDGVFATGQDVYLKDNTTGAETDLKAGSYTFTAAAGADNARFSLKYQKTLKVDANAFNENSVRVYKNNETIYVNSGNVAISNIKVFDIQGRLIVEQKNVKATSAVITNLRASNQVLIVTIAGEDNSVVTKKVMN